MRLLQWEYVILGSYPIHSTVTGTTNTVLPPSSRHKVDPHPAEMVEKWKNGVVITGVNHSIGVLSH